MCLMRSSCHLLKGLSLTSFLYQLVYPDANSKMTALNFENEIASAGPLVIILHKHNCCHVTVEFRQVDQHGPQSILEAIANLAEHSSNLPPGFRFYPSDEELVVHFLCRKAAHEPCQPNIIPTVDLHRCDPWDLDGKTLQVDNQWYFFALNTQHRVSSSGYWEAVGPDEPVTSGEGDRVGMKRTLVFYVHGGIKTDWVMHEYHLCNGVASTSTTNTSKSSKKRGNSRIDVSKWVICRVHETSYSCGFQDGGVRELSCMDEVFLSLDDLDEVSLPY